MVLPGGLAAVVPQVLADAVDRIPGLVLPVAQGFAVEGIDRRVGQKGGNKLFKLFRCKAKSYCRFYC